MRWTRKKQTHHEQIRTFLLGNGVRIPLEGPAGCGLLSPPSHVLHATTSHPHFSPRRRRN